MKFSHFFVLTNPSKTDAKICLQLIADLWLGNVLKYGSLDSKSTFFHLAWEQALHLGERSEPRERGTRVYFLRKKCTRRLPFTFIYHQYVGYIYSWRIFPSVVNKLC